MRRIWLVLLLVLSFVFLNLRPILGEPGKRDKDALTEKDVGSGKFRYLQQITGLDPLGLNVLYEISGAEEFDDFAFALTVAHLLRLDRQIVLGALHERSLQDVLEEMAVPDEQAEKAMKMAGRLLKDAQKRNGVGVIER